MRYVSLEEARKKIGGLGDEETAVTNRGKIAFYVIPPEEAALFRLFKRKARQPLLKERFDDMLSGKSKGNSFEDLA